MGASFDTESVNILTSSTNELRIVTSSTNEILLKATGWKTLTKVLFSKSMGFLRVVQLQSGLITTVISIFSTFIRC